MKKKKQVRYLTEVPVTMLKEGDKVRSARQTPGLINDVYTDRFGETYVSLEWQNGEYSGNVELDRCSKVKYYGAGS